MVFFFFYNGQWLWVNKYLMIRKKKKESVKEKLVADFNLRSRRSWFLNTRCQGDKATMLSCCYLFVGFQEPPVCSLLGTKHQNSWTISLCSSGVPHDQSFFHFNFPKSPDFPGLHSCFSEVFFFLMQRLLLLKLSLVLEYQFSSDVWCLWLQASRLRCRCKTFWCA